MIGQIRKLEDHAMNESRKYLPIYFTSWEARPELREQYLRSIQFSGTNDAL